ncbi:dihydrolipoamide acetyltransferase [Myxococcota bacterium]|nr:dihydrolipoamide acetyltransferase [Myxococcota bacterium]
MKVFHLALALAVVGAPSFARAEDGATATATTAAATQAPAVQKPAEATPDHLTALSAINTRIQEVEGKILLAKDKVDLLRDTIFGGTIARSRAVVVHRNEMGTSFVLERAVYTLDGGIIFSRENTDGALDANKEFELYNGPISPGDHDLVVSLIYSGSADGVFTYLKGYKFKVESKYRFNVPDGRMTTVSVVSLSKGDITANTSDRIGVRYDVETGPVPAALVKEEAPAAP